MKNRKINFLKLGIFLFGISLLLFNCDKEPFFENNLEENATNSTFSKRIINLNNIPKIKKVVDKMSFKKLASRNNNENVLFEENVTEIIDSLKHTNYTIKFKFSSTPNGTFYNLIIGKNADQILKTPVVFKYICDQSNVEEFLKSKFDWRYFKGKVEYHKYTDYFETDYFYSRTDCPDYLDADGNLITCDTEDIPSLGGGGGDPFNDVDDVGNVDAIGDGGGIDTDSNPPGGGGSRIQNCSLQTYIVGCGGSSSSTPHLYNSCGGPDKNIAPLFNVLECEAGIKRSSSRTDCVGCDNLDGVVQIDLESCRPGFVKDSNGNCVKKPCAGDPVGNLEIAPQLGASGIQGGLHNTCTRTGSGCIGNSSRKAHDGVDLKNPYGAPIYAIYDGTATLATQYKNGKVDGAGYHMSITSTVNGNTVRLVYFHMQQNGRVSGTVNAGDVIGYQGDSGNLKAGIAQGYTTSHLHIKARQNSQKVDPLNFLTTTINPNTGQVTNPCQ